MSMLTFGAGRDRDLRPLFAVLDCVINNVGEALARAHTVAEHPKIIAQITVQSDITLSRMVLGYCQNIINTCADSSSISS